MTTLQHAARYSAIIGNVYAAADKPLPLALFAVLSLLLMVASLLERKP